MTVQPLRVRTPSSEVPLPRGWRSFLAQVAMASGPPL